MSRVDDYGSDYEDVFVFEDLVYAMECFLGVLHVYRNRNNSLTKVDDVKYPCMCNDRLLHHSIIVTNERIIQCCAHDELVCILDRSGELLQKLHIADISGRWPILCQVDVEENFLIADPNTNRLLLAHAKQPASQWGVVVLADFLGFGGCEGAVWFRHRLYVASRRHLLIFTPVS